MADDDRSARPAELVHRPLRELLDRFELDVDQLESRGCRLQQDLELSSRRAIEAPTVLFASTGGDGRCGAVFSQKVFERRKREGRLRQIVEAKLQESGLLEDFGGLVDHLLRRCAADGNAKFADSGAKEMGCDMD